MRHCYARLTGQDRFHIKTRLDAGDSMRSIAGALRRSPSTVAREVRRNAEPQGCCALTAGRKAAARQRGKSPPRRMTPDTVALVNALLRIKWSPERITGFLRLILGLQAPCPVTIYEHVRRDRLGGGRLFNCLRHGGRRRKSRWTGRYEGRIPNRVDIDGRPAVVDARIRVGDWEADLVMGAGRRGAIVTDLERRTGLLLAKGVRRKMADATARALLDMLRPHRGDVRTLTFDNGREFSQHERIARSLGCDCYFAKPYHSWPAGAWRGRAAWPASCRPLSCESSDSTWPCADRFQRVPGAPHVPPLAAVWRIAAKEEHCHMRGVSPALAFPATMPQWAMRFSSDG